MTESSRTIHLTLATFRVSKDHVKIMVDTETTNSYVCPDLITKLGIRPVRQEQRCI